MRSGSDERVAESPWTHDFGPGFRCDLGSPFMNYIHVIHPTGQPPAVRKCFLHFLALDTCLLAKQKKVSRQRRKL